MTYELGKGPFIPSTEAAQKLRFIYLGFDVAACRNTSLPPIGVMGHRFVSPGRRDIVPLQLS